MTLDNFKALKASESTYARARAINITNNEFAILNFI